MKHFADEEWVDFSRSVLPQEKQDLMQEHLNEGCGSCGQSLTFWSKVGNTAKQEDNFEPPADVVNKAKTLCTMLPQRQKQGFGSVIGQLLFDSALQPLAAGVRSANLANRQLLFQKGTLYVDIRVEFDANASFIRVMGQLQDTKVAPDAMPAFKVELWHEEKAIVGTVSNEIGEFYLVGPRDKKLQLRIEHKQQNVSFDLQDMSED